MKTSTTLALAFIALAGVAGTAYAEQNGGDGMRGPGKMRLQKAMKDAGGSLTFDQFSAAMDTRLKKIVADNGGKVTVEQLAAALEKARFEEMAKRIMSRYASDSDGTLTTDAIQSREKKMFALMDRNDDGKVAQDELPRHGPGRHGGHDGGEMK
ncbi:hypothetical protein [Aminobacter sp. AP02]|uniref:hypothetical protein n=1 Tax=Aminobacter sp. AP02 TaxID=2135737 RepID=UPI000D6DAAA0|nr:hypothetical protein [Aminobacter sp. AP02]PWK75721.1 hypothetical protein C8K44_103290 [Aminobacter sp. AP02]